MYTLPWMKAVLFRHRDLEARYQRAQQLRFERHLPAENLIKTVEHYASVADSASSSHANTLCSKFPKPTGLVCE